MHISNCIITLHLNEKVYNIFKKLSIYAFEIILPIIFPNSSIGLELTFELVSTAVLVWDFVTV